MVDGTGEAKHMIRTGQVWAVTENPIEMRSRTGAVGIAE